MIRIALVEDEAEVRAQLQGYVQRYTRQYGTEFAVTEFADGMELLDDYRPVYDILFLDVEMKHLDGMETARRVRELDKDVIIVFITNMAQYAIGGYAVGALDYVLKPVPYFAFSQQLRKAEEQLRRPEISYPLLAGVIGWGEEITPMLAERLETEIKYAGYIARQDRMIHEVARHEKTLIPEDFEYAALTGLTLEAREKLARIRPRNLGQAGRIPGVSPSDVAQLSIALAGKQQK